MAEIIPSGFSAGSALHQAIVDQHAQVIVQGGGLHTERGCKSGWAGSRSIEE